MKKCPEVLLKLMKMYKDAQEHNYKIDSRIKKFAKDFRISERTAYNWLKKMKNLKLQ